LFALPSEHENFGNAAREALASGTAALLSPQVDLADDLGEEAGCFRAPLDSTAWAERFRTLLAAAAAPASASRYVRERFAWRRLADELTGRYRWVRAGCPREP